MSSSSLYGYKANVTVSANNLTTLYNAQPGNVVVVDVPDRNFTTLYTNQTTISPTKAYGNSNVEAFLNQGTDGANIVQNINMHGMLTVGGASYLGNVGNVHITGGNSGYVLTTNGVGNLIWAEPTGGGGEGTEYIHFDVTSTANNQQFTNANLELYANANVINLFKNGVNIEPTYFEKIANATIQVNIPLSTGDTIDILASNGGGGGLPAGLPNTVQYNDGFTFAGSNSFTFDPTSNTLSVTNITSSGLVANGVVNLGTVGNVHINGGNVGELLTTNGSGNLSWTTITTVNHANIADVANSVSVGNVTGIGNIATINLDGNSSHVLYGNGSWASAALIGGSNTFVQFNDNGVFNGVANFAFNKTSNTLSVTNVSTSSLTNVLGAVERAVFATGVTGTYTYDTSASSVVLCTSDTAGNFTIDFTNLSLTDNDVRSFAFINKNAIATTYHVTGISINSVSQTVNWLGGSAPSTGGLNDIYNITIIQTSTGVYSVFASVGSF